ncbi:MAG: hypothetical protein PVF70_01565 [Anaerolineales bacterium]|jgi:hypothetical protein
MNAKINPRIAIPLTALLLLIHACSLPTFSPETQVTAARLPSPWPTPTITASATTPDPQDAPTSTPIDLSPEVQAQMETLENQTITLRGLVPTGPVERNLLSSEELRQYVLDDLLADYSPEEATIDTHVLSLLGLLEPGFDLLTLYIDLYSEQVAGFYDPIAKQLFVVSGATFGGTAQMSYVHEYTHVLQDQVYDLQYGLEYDDQACDQDSERCAAILALIEGDAMLVSEQWLRTYATDQDLADIFADALEMESPVLLGAPDFLKEDLLFPYIHGLAFVRQLYLSGGWAAVDAAYLNPPLSTEQILHPERYPNDRPIDLVVPGSITDHLDQGWTELDWGVIGEWYFRLMLAQHLPTDIATAAAAGWGGDYYLAFYNQELGAGALVFVTIWDLMRDASSAFSAMRDYGDARFGEHGGSRYSPWWETEQAYALLEGTSKQTLWIVAPDSNTAQALRQAIAFPASSDD